VGTLSTDLFLGWLPDEPDAALALYETPGQPPTYIHQAVTPAILHPSVQVLVRDTDYASGRARIQDAYDTLCALGTYLALRPLQEPFALGRDANDRPRFAVNFVITQRGG
jgi:hypothetical protein